MLHDILAIAHSHHISPREAMKIWQNRHDHQQQIENLQRQYSNSVTQAIQWAQQPQHHIITCAQDNYPERLFDLYDPPLLLFAIGNIDLLHSTYPTTAIVGSRQMSIYGQQVTNHLLTALAPDKHIIVSGLALGIDGCAHRCALDHGLKTIAILAQHPSIIYPKRHQQLYERILDQQGLIIGEHTTHAPLLPRHFIQRNRLIAALSQRTIIAEAASNSGALSTAQFALELHRQVYAVPGPVFHRNSIGCHQLIEQGAQPLYAFTAPDKQIEID